MFAVSGYTTQTKIHDGDNSLVYRGIRNKDQQPVILKFLKDAYPSPKRLSLFKREFEIAHKFELPGVVKSYSLHQEQNHWLIVMEDFGGTSLDRLPMAGNLAIDSFLELGLELIKILDPVHQQNIIHKDINPSNFVFNVDTQTLKLIDFGISIELTHEIPIFQSPYQLEGTLAYLSPEQTGRMNRMVDHRSDFYSLGIAFYQLLTGELPFSGEDTLEWIHCHLAQEPVPPEHYLPDIPEMLSRIILKLISKNAEDRYQSSYGLKKDLEKCLQQWRSRQEVSSFVLGEEDRIGQFRLTDKLYGRETERKTLLTAFEDSHSGQGQLVLIAGHAGVGKTMLVKEVYQPLTLQKGYFISGKFDQLQQNQPYASFINAFQMLIRQILTESETAIIQWREKLEKALGINGQVMLDVIPEVELILGPQPDLPELGPTESENRFLQTFSSFIHVFAQNEHPLVLFLDDLQWVDSGSLKLLEAILTTGEKQALLIIGSYRDEEIELTHPLQNTIKNLENQGGRLSKIFLKSLNTSHLVEWMQDSFHVTSEVAQPFAELLLKKTGGNPFFINEFFHFLYQKSLLTFDQASSQWQWDLEHIQNQQITENVAGLLASKMERLSPTIQTLLQRAASLGNRFDLKILAIVLQISMQEVGAYLWTAIQEEILLPLGDEYKYVQFSEGGFEATIEYQFVHDRVQQAAYQIVAEHERKQIHWDIGQSLLQAMDQSQLEQQVFDFISHLNLGRDTRSQAFQIETLAHYNLVACKKAKNSVAFQSAYQYAQIGLEMLSSLPNIWQTNKALAKELYEQAAETACLIADYESMESSVEVLLQQAETPLEQIKGHEVRIQAYTAQNQYDQAVKEALVALSLLNVSFPNNPSFDDIQQAVRETKQMIKERASETFIELPLMTDLEKLAAMRIMNAVWYSSWNCAPLLSILFSVQQVNLSIQYGNTSESISAYLYFGVALHPLLSDADLAYSFSQLSSKLAEKLNIKLFIPISILLNFWYLKHWKEPINQLLAQFRKGVQVGLEIGNYTDATNCLVATQIGNLLQGEVVLSQLFQQTDQAVQTVHKLKQTTLLPSILIFRQAILNWMGKSEHPWKLKGDFFDEERIPDYVTNDEDSVFFIMRFVKGILCYHFRQNELVIENLTKTLNDQKIAGHFFLPIATMYLALAQLSICKGMSEETSQPLLDNAREARDKLKQWAEHCPINYQHRYLLVEAELARVEGLPQLARNYYDEAIETARQYHYHQDDALACELAGKFYLEEEQTRVAYYYLRDAHYTYQHWEAFAKVNQLEEDYPQLLIQKSGSGFNKRNRQSSIITGATDNQQLDFESLLKASQTLSENLVLDKLVVRMLGIVMENAGAQKGAYLLKKNGQWVVEAVGTVDKEVEVQRPSILLGASDYLPQGMLNYVMQTQKTVVQGNAYEAEIYQNDEYVQNHQLKSALCQPVFHQGELSGILYLENNLMTDAFTEDRLEVLQTLLTQITISLDNASLYSNLEEKVQQRTAELKAAQEKLIVLEKEATEKQMAGGFAHEMRNSLLGPKMLLDQLLGLDNADPVSQNTQNIQQLKKVHDAFEEKLYQKDFEEVLAAMKTMYENFEASDKRLKVIHASTSRAMKTTNQILAYARVDHETTEIEMIDVHQLLHDIVAEHQAEFESSDIQIEFDLKKEVVLPSRSTHLHTVFNNLILNAKDALQMEEPSQSSAVAKITITSKSEANHCQIIIMDTGVGIPEDELDKIFDAFFSTKPATGTGLGLSMVKKIITLYRGQIDVKSQPGKGTAITISLPRQ